MRRLREIGCIVSGEVEGCLRRAVRAEQIGFDHLRLPDHILSISTEVEFPEAWMMLAAIGLQTKRIRLSTGVGDPYRRHPSNIAHTLATLDRLTQGRAALGLGAGEAMNITPFGIPWRRPVAGLREALIIIKRLLQASRERPVSFEGEIFRLKGAYLQVKPVQKPHPPLYVGALGPRMRRLTGELADGWYPWVEAPRTLKKHLREVKEGARSVGRRVEDLDVVATLCIALSEDYERALEAARIVSSPS